MRKFWRKKTNKNAVFYKPLLALILDQVWRSCWTRFGAHFGPGLALILDQKLHKICGCQQKHPVRQNPKLRQNAPNCANNLNAFSAQQNVISKWRFFRLAIFFFQRRFDRCRCLHRSRCAKTIQNYVGFTQSLSAETKESRISGTEQIFAGAP